jgi:ion channel-forming bestrophin family protein
MVKFLPSYALPAGMPPQVDNRDSTSLKEQQQSQVTVQHLSSVNPRRGSFPGGYIHRSSSVRNGGTLTNSESAPHLPLPTTSPGETNIKQEKVESLDHPQPTRTSTGATSKTQHYVKESLSEPSELLPARNPPQRSIYDLFPFSLLVKCLTHRGKQVKGKKGAFIRAMLRRQMVSHNLPLEISLYLVCFPFYEAQFSFSHLTTQELVHRRAPKS